MKKLFLTFAFAIVATLTAMAQQISVVSTTGATTLYRTLQDAIEGADPGSVIYLPGGGFSIADSVKINKKLTIIGIGHKSNNDNVDGVTTISGNLFFNEGSSSSAVIGCYITGDVNIGEDGNVDNVLITYCNLNGIGVINNLCMETTVKQNYIRGSAVFNGSKATVSNNIVGGGIGKVNGGQILNNIIVGHYHDGTPGRFHLDYGCIGASNSLIKGNLITTTTNYSNDAYYFQMLIGGNNTIISNMSKYDFGDDCINLGEVDWNNVFVKYNGVSATSNFHFKEDYTQYEGQVGIYHGTFNDNQLAPVPYIVDKRVDEQTDASGKLNVKIRVKAGQ